MGETVASAYQLALARAPGWKRLALGLSALVPGLALGLGVMAVGVFRAPLGVVTAYERRLRDIPTIWTPIPMKLARLRLSAAIARLAGRGLLRGSFTSAHAVKTLDVSLWRGNVVASASCRWWSRHSHALRRGACSQPHWMKATLRRHGRSYTWTLKLGGVPPAGRYTLIFQAVPRSKALAPSARTRMHLRVR